MKNLHSVSNPLGALVTHGQPYASAELPTHERVQPPSMSGYSPLVRPRRQAHRPPDRRPSGPSSRSPTGLRVVRRPASRRTPGWPSGGRADPHASAQPGRGLAASLAALGRVMSRPSRDELCKYRLWLFWRDRVEHTAHGCSAWPRPGWVLTISPTTRRGGRHHERLQSCRSAAEPLRG